MKGRCPVLSTTAMKRRKGKSERSEQDQLTKIAKREATNPLVSKEEARSVVSSAQILAGQIDQLADAIQSTATRHHVQPLDVLRAIERRIRG